MWITWMELFVLHSKDAILDESGVTFYYCRNTPCKHLLLLQFFMNLRLVLYTQKGYCKYSFVGAYNWHAD